MKKVIFIFILANLFIIKVLAQEKPPKYLEDKYSWYASLSLGNAIGKYHTVLKASDKSGTKAGFVLGGLMNPYNRKKASTVFYGAEIGYQSDGQDDVTLNNAQGSFYVANNSFWLNGMARYRPILWSSKINPYADAFFGAKLIKSNIVEQISQDETQVFEKFGRLVPNYGLGVGAGIKLSGQLKNNYLDIGVYFQQAEATKIMQRNSVNINSAYVASYKQILTSTNQIVVKIGLTGFM
jgi:hypothetical protein